MRTALCTLAFIIVFASAALSRHLVVPVEGVIDGGLAAFVERALSAAANEGADGVLLHIDTPGGRIDSAVAIKDAILRSSVPVIAFVDKSAISAGALISLACDSLYMATGASIGAATAVDLQGNKASEKVISYFRAQMCATAEATGRRTDLAEAMVDEDIAVEGVIEAGKLLTLTTNEALELDFADGTADTVEDVLALAGHPDATYVRLTLTWAEYVVRFLTHPLVSSLLMSVGFLGILVEIRTPGWGVGGTIAIIALVLFFGSQYIVRLAGWEELLLFTVGIVLLAIEAFIIPGFGIAGVGGIVCIVASMYLSLVGRMPHIADFERAAYMMGCAILLTAAGAVLILRFLPGSALFRRLALETVEGADAGYTSADTDDSLMGAQGVTLTPLRPSGKALVGGRKLDVVAEGEFLDRDVSVTVTEARGSRVVVKRAE